jgi:hypothetical protein
MNLIIFPTQLLLPEKSSALEEFIPSEEELEDLKLPAAETTANREGVYYHGGLNE